MYNQGKFVLYLYHFVSFYVPTLQWNRYSIAMVLKQIYLRKLAAIIELYCCDMEAKFAINNFW